MRTLFVYNNGSLVKIAKCSENEAKQILDECSKEAISESNGEPVSMCYCIN